MPQFPGKCATAWNERSSAEITPVVTVFEFKPDAGVKYNRIVSLPDDLCIAIEAESIRIGRISGK